MKREDILDFNERKKNEEQVKEEKSSKSSAAKDFFGWILTLVIAIVVAVLLKNYVIINASVPTGSMENTILPGDDLFGFRLAYTFSDPKRGDIIIFKNPDNRSEKYIKRLIGLPGEKVVVDKGIVTIDGTVLEEPYLKEEWTYTTGPFEFNVPEDCYLFFGDNRNDSLDARYWTSTYVPREDIIGKALAIYFPFDRIGVLD